MIRPTKYLDLNFCVLNVAATILVELQTSRAIALDELDLTVRSRIGEMAKFNFLSALNLLYLVGKIDYLDESDAIFSINSEYKAE